MVKVGVAFGVLLLAAQAASAQNLIVNGDFEGGNTGFTSDYNYVDSNHTDGASMYPEGSYTVGKDANLYHNLWVSRTDHTSGSGNYMIVNGNTSDPGTTNVWQSNLLTLTAGKYDFSAFFTDVCCTASSGVTDAPAVLTFYSTDGMSTVSLGTATVGSTGNWMQGSAVLTVLANTTGYVSLRNATTAFSGNDFGVDDISLVRVGDVPEPASWAMMLGGFGLVGGAMRRRKTTMTFA